MKKYFLLLTTILSATISVAQNNLNWTTLNTGTTKNINDLYFSSPDTGYVVGDHYLFMKTTDGGATWTHLTPPANGERVNNNGNIVGIDHHYIRFSTLDSGLYLSWEKPLHGNITGNEGTSYSIFPYSDSNLLCSVNGFTASPDNQGNGYVHLLTYGQSCNGNAAFTDYYDGSFSIQLSDSSLSNQAGSFVDADVDNGAFILGHTNGYLLRYENFFSSPDSIYLDSSGILSVAYAGNNKWYASTNSDYYNLYVSLDSGKTFAIDSTFPPTFFYPKINDFSFVSYDMGIAGARSSGIYGSIMVRDSGQWSVYGAPHPINKVKLFDNGVAYAVGDSGLVMKTRLLTTVKEESSPHSFLKVYPNPVDDQLTLSGLKDRSVDMIQLLGIRGELLKNYPSTKRTFNLSTLPKGYYLLKVVSEGESLSTKIIVE